MSSDEIGCWVWEIARKLSPMASIKTDPRVKATLVLELYFSWMVRVKLKELLNISLAKYFKLYI